MNDIHAKDLFLFVSASLTLSVSLSHPCYTHKHMQIMETLLIPSYSANAVLTVNYCTILQFTLGLALQVQ